MTATKLATGLAMVSLDSLHESPDNPREISDERFDALCYSLHHDPNMMKARPMIATPDGEVVCGNMRLRALIKNGQTEGYAFIEELDAKRKREWMLRDNNEYGDWVPDELAALVAAHRSDEGDMKLLGLSDERQTALLKQHDAVPPEPGGGNNTVPDVWGVVVECESEDEQAKLVERLSDEGFNARALIP